MSLRCLHLFAALCIAVVLPVAALAETRVALIIANSHYLLGTLKNPSADAHLVEAALKKAGFQVTVLEDLKLDAMNRALRQFGNESDQSDVALIYFAGHGVEVDHVNYMVPVDAEFNHDRDVDIEAVKLDTMLAYTQNARRLRLVILDACRDNPFNERMQRSGARAGAVSKGLATVEVSNDTLVVYSAKAGTTASDGRVNSPFAISIAQRIGEQPGKEINMLFRYVHDDVLEQTRPSGAPQEPTVYGTLSTHEFYFIPPAGGASPAAIVNLETESWGLCKTAQGRGPCDAYLKTYGVAGRYAALVNTRIADLGHPATGGTVAAARSASIPAAMAAPLPAVSFASARVGALGFSVHYDPVRKGLLVDSIDHDAPYVTGKLFAGDVIMRIDMTPADAAQPPDTQLAANWAADGRLNLLVKRGDAPTTVRIKKDN